MSILNTNIEKEIEAQKRVLEKLEAQRQAQQQKLEGVAQFDNVISELCEKYGLSESELLSSRGDKFVSVLRQAGKLDTPPKYFDRIKALFVDVEKPASRAKKAKKARKKIVSNEPKLPIGVYANPHSGEQVEKIKRAPKLLKDWAQKYGDATVLGWKK